MVINKKGGKKGKKTKNSSQQEGERKLILKDDDQEYCQVLRLLGNCRIEGQCFDGKIRLCNIRGSMRKKMWIKVGDIVIVSLRDFEDNKCDIIYLYKNEEVKKLIKLGDLPEHVDNDNNDNNKDDIGFEFKDENDEQDEEKIINKDFENTFNNI